MKYIIIIIILITLIAGGFFTWQYWKMPEEVKDEITNWKIYQNKEYGFEVKYPSTWAVAEEQDLWEERGFLKITFEGPGKIEKRLVESMGQEEEIIESGAQLIVSYEQGLLPYECGGVPGFRAFCCPPACEVVEIAGKQATKTLKKDVGFIQNNWQWQAEVDSEKPFPRRVFFLLRYNPENYPSAEKNFSQMLSTFKFLE